MAILGSCDAFGAEVSGGCGSAVNTIRKPDVLLELFVVLPVVLLVVSPDVLFPVVSVGAVLEDELHPTVNNSTLPINTINFTAISISMVTGCCCYLV